MQIAILGGTGSIGMATAAHIAQRGVDISLLSRRRPGSALPDGVSWLSTDVTDTSSVGEGRIHLTFLADAANATCAVLLSNQPVSSVYNAAGILENYVSLRELHTLVRELVPGAGRALWSGHARSLGPADVSLISKDVGWKPRVTLETLLSEMGRIANPVFCSYVNPSPGAIR